MYLALVSILKCVGSLEMKTQSKKESIHSQMLMTVITLRNFLTKQIQG